MFIHTVYFWLKDGTSEDARGQLLRDCREYLGKIPAVKHLWVGIPAMTPREVALARGERATMVAAVNAILADVAERGDAAIVESSRRFDDPNFSVDQIGVSAAEMREAVSRVPTDQMAALRRSIAQVKEYQVK